MALSAQDPTMMPRLESVKRTLLKKHAVHVVLPKVKTRRFGRIPSAIIRYLSYSLQEATAKAECLHLFNAPDFIHWPSFFRRCKICYDYRSNYSEKLMLAYPQIARLSGHLEKALARRAGIVLTVNAILAKRIRSITSKRTFVVPNYPSKTFVPTLSRSEARRKWRFSRSYVAVFVGNLTFTYQFELILEAARVLPNVEFWIVGSGKQEDTLKRIASPNVRFLGRVPHSEVPNVLVAADVCLVPIRRYQDEIVHNEEDVWKITEAAAIQKPIVATGVVPSSQYLSTSPRTDEFTKAILKALKGEAPTPEPRHWEEYCEPVLLEAYEVLERKT